MLRGLHLPPSQNPGSAPAGHEDPRHHLHVGVCHRVHRVPRQENITIWPPRFGAMRLAASRHTRNATHVHRPRAWRRCSSRVVSASAGYLGLRGPALVTTMCGGTRHRACARQAPRRARRPPWNRTLRLLQKNPYGRRVDRHMDNIIVSISFWLCSSINRVF
jgi:hypothetical protein